MKQNLYQNLMLISIYNCIFILKIRSIPIGFFFFNILGLSVGVVCRVFSQLSVGFSWQFPIA